MKTAREILLGLSIVYKGDWEKIYTAITKKDKSIDIDEVIKGFKMDYITLLDEDYPEEFKRYWKPPFVLYYKGNINLLKEPKKIGVVGSRDASAYGINMTKETVSELVKKGYVIVSGLAKGIDGVALQEAVKDGRGIAFLGNGIDYFYPKENFQLQNDLFSKGLVMSEYPPGVGPSPQNFPFRNRLISFLSKGLLVAEAKQKSGTLITAGYAIENSLDVFCFPYQAKQGSACNCLIKDGACLVEGAKDIIDILES